MFFPLVVLGCFFLLLASKIVKRSHKSTTRNLPPGSMGWPFVGETLRMYSQSPSIFFGTKLKRYGDIFKTHIHGNPCVMMACPEAARFVLVTEARMFKTSYPEIKMRILGKWAVFFTNGEFHAQIRKIVQRSLTLDTVRHMVPAIDATAISTLESCCNSDKTISTFHYMKKYTFEVAMFSIFGELENDYKVKLNKNYSILDTGYNSLFPINFPGTPFHRALQARKKLYEILCEIISTRKEKILTQNNLLSSLLNYKDVNGKTLTDVQITDNIVGVLFAAQDTTATSLTWIIKHIHDNPAIFEAIKVEQKAIYEENNGGKLPLSWAQTRKMPYTTKVVMESMRMASIIAYTYREAVEDVNYNGVLIPKGWRVMPLFRAIHHNPSFFEEPEHFNPSRFEVAPRPNTFVPFGNGIHSCPGNEVAKLEILVMVHHLVNSIRCEIVESSSDVQYDPFLVPKGGLPAKFSKG